MTEGEIADCQSQARLTESRVQMERQNTKFVGDINQYAFLKGSAPSADTTKEAAAKAEAKPAGSVNIAEKNNAANAVKPHISSKYDWYQNAQFIFLTFKVIGDKELAKNTKVEFTESSVSLTWNDENITISLAGKIDPSLS